MNDLCHEPFVSAQYSTRQEAILLSLNVYPLLGAGWGSNSKYAALGGLRAAAQTISYEISLAFILIRFMVFWDGPRISVG